jgi:hypothetical protein
MAKKKLPPALQKIIDEKKEKCEKTAPQKKERTSKKG